MVRELIERLKGFPMLVGGAFLLGYVVGALLADGAVRWGTLFAVWAPVALAAALFVALLRGRSAWVFAFVEVEVGVGLGEPVLYQDRVGVFSYLPYPPRARSQSDGHRAHPAGQARTMDH